MNAIIRPLNRAPDIHIKRPSTKREHRVCNEVAEAIQEMVPLTIDMQLSHVDIPYVRIVYRGGTKPKLSWRWHLWCRVDMEEHGSWLGRLAHFKPHGRELWIAPRNDATEPLLAWYGVTKSVEPRIRCVHLGTPFTRSGTRTFYTDHLPHLVH